VHGTIVLLAQQSLRHWKSTVIEKPANADILIEGIAERGDLRLHISILPGIEDPLSVDEFIEPLAEQVIAEDIDNNRSNCGIFID